MYFRACQSVQIKKMVVAFFDEPFIGEEIIDICRESYAYGEWAREALQRLIAGNCKEAKEEQGFIKGSILRCTPVGEVRISTIEEIETAFGRPNFMMSLWYRMLNGGKGL